MPRANVRFDLIEPQFGEGKSIKVTRRQLLKAAVKTTKRGQKEYKTVSNKFKHGKPNYELKESEFSVPPSGGEPALWAAVTTKHGPMVWLDQGTRIRYRTMTPNFQSLTKPRSGLQTFRRRGRASGWGIHPGIEPRYFSEDAAKRVKEQFINDAELIFKKRAGVIFRQAIRRRL